MYNNNIYYYWRIFIYYFIILNLFLLEYKIYYYRYGLYQYVINPIEIVKDIFIFSSIKEENRVRIILFVNIINNITLLNNMNCIFKGNIITQSRMILKQYISLHEKYYNLFCFIPTNIKNYNLYIANSRVSLYNNLNKLVGKYNLLFCLTTLFSYNNTKRFSEFVEYYINFGVDKFIVYNTNCSKQMEELLRYYVNLNIMDIILDNFTHNLYEMKRFHVWKHNDCFHKYKHFAKKIIFTDHDEIIYSPIYKNGNLLFSHLNQSAASYHFYPKLKITYGKGFFHSGNYSICPFKSWKFVINNPLCVLHVTVHDVILKRKCFKERVAFSIGYVLHGRNEPSYHAKSCKNWIFENTSQYSSHKT